MSENKSPATGNHGETVKAHLGEAGSHLKQAANLAGTTARHAAEAAGDELKVGAGAVREELDASAQASKAAAAEARAAAEEQFDAVLGKGKEFLASAEALIREKPLAAFGVAFAAGFLISRLGRR